MKKRLGWVLLSFFLVGCQEQRYEREESVAEIESVEIQQTLDEVINEYNGKQYGIYRILPNELTQADWIERLQTWQETTVTLTSQETIDDTSDTLWTFEEDAAPESDWIVDNSQYSYSLVYQKDRREVSLYWAMSQIDFYVSEGQILLPEPQETDKIRTAESLVGDFLLDILAIDEIDTYYQVIEEEQIAQFKSVHSENFDPVKDSGDDELDIEPFIYCRVLPKIDAITVFDGVIASETSDYSRWLDGTMIDVFIQDGMIKEVLVVKNYNVLATPEQRVDFNSENIYTNLSGVVDLFDNKEAAILSYQLVYLPVIDLGENEQLLRPTLEVWIQSDEQEDSFVSVYFDVETGEEVVR